MKRRETKPRSKRNTATRKVRTKSEVLAAVIPTLPNGTERIVSIDESMARLNVSRTTLWRIIRTNKLRQPITDKALCQYIASVAGE